MLVALPQGTEKPDHFSAIRGFAEATNQMWCITRTSARFHVTVTRSSCPCPTPNRRPGRILPNVNTFNSHPIPSFYYSFFALGRLGVENNSDTRQSGLLPQSVSVSESYFVPAICFSIYPLTDCTYSTCILPALLLIERAFCLIKRVPIDETCLSPVQYVVYYERTGM